LYVYQRVVDVIVGSILNTIMTLYAKIVKVILW
jgi:hypothetical protein